MNEKKVSLRIAIFLFVFVCLHSFSNAQNQSAKNKTLSFSKLKYLNIGSATKEGNFKINKSQLEMVAGGADIWGTHDEFMFACKKLKGDFDMSVQVLNLSKANLYTKAGIMARTDLSDSSQHIYFQLFPDNSARNKNNGGCEFQYRAEKGMEMRAIYPNMETVGNLFDVTFPNTWIRLKRSGDVFESYLSHDNKTWNMYTTFTQKMPVELLVGLAVTSHNSNEFTTATFGSLQLIK